MRGFAFRWPDYMQHFLNVYFVASGGVAQAFSPECVTKHSIPDTYINLLMSVLAAPFFLGVTTLLLRVVDVVKGVDTQPHRLWIVTVTVVFLFQPMAVSACVEVFTCSYVGDAFVMYSDMEVECGSSSHLLWGLAVALPGLLVYAVAVPVLSYQKMRAFFADRLRSSGRIEDAEEGLRLWGPLVNMFSDAYYWWALMIM